MSSQHYRITEPHPSVPASNYYLSGRGGAGNLTYINPKKVSAGPDASGPASSTTIRAPPANAYFTAGRGGAGNLHREKERAMFSFDEELDRQRKLMEHQAPVYSIGRGGAGNIVDEMSEKRRASGSSRGSTSSSDGVRHSMEGAWNKVRGIGRH
ncbi:hypothetical protein EJ08DRAFT_650422 [Tothia fuscella]|uniref:Uncharacterized protein n=1 Tax=Tothia fuscella TaxID=1048955 RepID=A0A9P4NPP5_9PEZI|nr:hypothetical protein EJ08DRAFT_650422 [Tothia fuscella]